MLEGDGSYRNSTTTTLTLQFTLLCSLSYNQIGITVLYYTL